MAVRMRIVDAAEALLAQRGYYGVTMRDVAGEAGAKLGTVTYHFPTKEALFSAVILRRSEEYVSRTEAALIEAMKGSPTLEGVLHAYFAPAIDLSLHGGPGWNNYMRMLAGAMNVRQHEIFLTPVLENYDPLFRRVLDAFAKLYPGTEERDLQWAFFFVEASFIHILVEAGLIDRHSGGECRSSDLEEILARIVPFFAAALRETMAPVAATRRASR